MIDWLMCGALIRYPNIKVAFSESQIGWIPFMLERADNIWHKDRPLHDISPLITNPPSSYFAGRIFGCFFEDDFGLASRETIGVDQITFESDYPHQDSLWPDTRAYAERAMAGLTSDDIYKIVRDNALKLLGLPRTLQNVNVSSRQPRPTSVGK
jgi:predicted TIM-barrel fold metal-dependent hydrolase